MNVIEFEEDIFINPDHIVYLERVRRGNKVYLEVYADGRLFKTTNPSKAFISAMIKSGVDLSKQFISL